MINPKSKSLKAPKKQYWYEIIKEGLSSGKNIATYCQEKKIGIASFYQWRNRLMPNYPKRSTSRMKDTKIPADKLFVPIHISVDNDVGKPILGNDKLTLHYPNGCYLLLNGSFEIETLKRLNQAMGI